MSNMDLTALIPAETAIARRRATALAQLADLRWQHEVAGLILPKGAPFDGARVATDRHSQMQIAIAAQAGGTRRWKMASGWLTLSPKALADLADRVAMHVQAGFDAEDQLTQQIAASPAPEALDLTTAFAEALSGIQPNIQPGVQSEAH